MTSAFKDLIHARMRQIFGDPDSSLGRDDHWSLKMKPNMAPINVLVNGTDDIAAIWVFDPHIKDDGVLRAAVKDLDGLDAIIVQIQQRLQQAAEKYRQD